MTGTYNLLKTELIEDNYWYEIKSLYGCCGCFTYYSNLYEGRILREQFVLGINCTGATAPTKHVFKLNPDGDLKVSESYLAVAHGQYDLALNKWEQKMLKELDLIQRTDNSVNFSKAYDLNSVKGYIKVEYDLVNLPITSDKKKPKVPKDIKFQEN